MTLPVTVAEQLLVPAIAEATKLLQLSCAEAVILRSRSIGPEQAEADAKRRWREKWPALAALVDHGAGSH